MEGMPVVLRGTVGGERPDPAPRPDGDPDVWTVMPRSAPTVHALLPDVQAEDPATVGHPRASRSLPALPLVRLPAVLAVLSLVRTAPQPGQLPADLRLNPPAGCAVERS